MRGSPIAIPESATADDVWLRRDGPVERAAAKIVTSGTYTSAIVSVLSTHFLSAHRNSGTPTQGSGG